MDIGWRWGRAVSRLAVVMTIAVAATTAQAEPKVVATIKPIHALVAGVMTGAGEASLLLDGATSPHDYAMKPSDVRRINSADLVVRVSAQLETFLVKPLKLAPKGVRVLTLDAVDGIKLRALRSGEGYETHRHAHGPNQARGHGQHVSTSSGGASKAIKPIEADPHLWLDPANARAIVQAVASALSEIDPGHAAVYAKNAAALSQRLEALDASLAAELTPLARRRYIVFHDAYQYLEDRYGLAGAGSVTLSPEVAPSAQRLSRIRTRLATEGIICVFAEPQFQPKAIDTVIEGTVVKKGVLDPLGAAIAPGPEQYFKVMRGLARDLQSCLAEVR